MSGGVKFYEREKLVAAAAHWEDSVCGLTTSGHAKFWVLSIT